MSYITLIRHGQANSAALNEADYDRLSPLGFQQAEWLGTYLRDTQMLHTRLYTGALRRHAETASAMATGLDPVVDPRLNELEFFTLSHALEAEHGIAAPEDASQFVHHFPVVLEYWRKGRIEGAPESFDAFEARIADVMAEISQGEGPALVVTSGGTIAMTMRHYLGLDIERMARVGLAIMNASVHRLHTIGDVWTPVAFNAVPHLELPERHHAKTHV